MWLGMRTDICIFERSQFHGFYVGGLLYERNANQSYDYRLPCASQNGHLKKSTNNKCWRRCGGNGNLLNCYWECKLVQLPWKTVWGTLKNKNRVTVWSCNHREKMKIQKDTCISMFLVALLTTAKACKEAKCPLANEWKKKDVVYIKRPPTLVSAKVWNRSLIHCWCEYKLYSHFKQHLGSL